MDSFSASGCLIARRENSPECTSSGSFLLLVLPEEVFCVIMEMPEIFYPKRVGRWLKKCSCPQNPAQAGYWSSATPPFFGAPHVCPA